MQYDANELLDKISVLVVEDEDAIRDKLVRFLKRRVGALYAAANGMEGLDLFQAHQPDIVITDIRMPVMTGLEMAEAIRKIAPDIPILVITAYNDQDYFLKSIEIGINRYVLKPADTERILKAVIDIAESLYNKKELEKIRKDKEDMMRLQSLSQLIKGLSHNFNNILVGILGYAGLIRMKLLESKDVQELGEIVKYIDIIEKSSERAAGLIKHLITFSSKMTYEKQDMDINNTITKVLEIISLSFPQDIKIETVLKENLPFIHADKDNIAQAILNICINTKEAMPKGGVLKIETAVEHDHVIIKISDSGCGMDEDTKRRIFEPFFTTKGIVDHLGLGLSISHSIIREHGGFIRVESEQGKGTEFTVYLPVLKKRR